MTPRFRLPLLALLCLAVVPAVVAAQSPPPTIHSVTLHPDTGVLTIAGAHLGAELLVTVDGQPVTTLPGATADRLEVQAPVSVRSTPGTYRLSVVDPVRRAWDGFIVASAPPAVGAGGIARTAGAGEPYTTPSAATAPLANASAAAGTGADAADAAFAPRPLAIIEDTGTPFRTALGHLALSSNTTATQNTAVGFEALRLTSSGGSNVGVGAHALEFNTTGTQNVAIGRDAMLNNSSGGSNTAIGTVALAFNLAGFGNVAVGTSALLKATSTGNVAVGTNALDDLVSGSDNIAIGLNAGGMVTGSHNIHIGTNQLGNNDANVIRLGIPFDSSTLVGQNRTYIAGIRGTTVTGGEGVYVASDGRLGSGPVVPAANTVGSAQVIADALTAADLAPASVGTSEIADGSVTPAKVAFAFAGLGANTFSGTQQIGSGNLDLAPSTAANGNVTKGGVRFLHNPGFMNTFLGESAGTSTLTGGTNTAVGADALRSITSGDANAASGYGALFLNSTGTGNTASGMQALFQATGSHNTAIGFNAGTALTTGSHNIYVGSEVFGTAADANTMRLGLPFNATSGAGQNKTFIAGVAGTVLTTPAVQVFIDGNGQLGTLVPPPISGTISAPVSAQPGDDSALQRTIADQARRIADLEARLARLEARLRGAGR